MGEVPFEFDIQSHLHRLRTYFLNEELNSDLIEVEVGNTELAFDPFVGEEGKDRFADGALVFRVFLCSIFPAL